ncbi:MAG TPA: hypothetical protein VMC83_33695 [Streptosporangiaceae bacterium]|nr:hypothetical protein [Streptosporangiaceae bacterium]
MLSWFNGNVWKPALEETGLIPRYSRHDYPAAPADGMHAVRHWYSTHLQDAGLPLAAVIDWLGHSQDSVPLAVGTYGSVTPEAFEKARQVIDTATYRHADDEEDQCVSR